MKHIAAYLLLQLGGKSTPSAADITSVLEAAGAEVDSGRVEKLIAELEGKDINEVGLGRGPWWFSDGLLIWSFFCLYLALALKPRLLRPAPVDRRRILQTRLRPLGRFRPYRLVRCCRRFRWSC